MSKPDSIKRTRPRRPESLLDALAVISDQLDHLADRSTIDDARLAQIVTGLQGIQATLEALPAQIAEATSAHRSVAKAVGNAVASVRARRDSYARILRNRLDL